MLVGAGVTLAVVAAAATVVLVRDDNHGGGECPGADGRSGVLRRCLSESIAFIETPLGAGSGLLLEDGYVVTNAHVIDPYSVADVTFTGGQDFADVAVIGVDAAADIAVLGPLDVDAPSLRLDPIPNFDEDDEPDVFLVGYPGGVESGDPSVTLAGGLLSRVREDETFGLTYLQTDAAIAGGQSGGALVDGNGTVLGVSGLGFAEEFALALASDDVAAAVDRILEGAGDDRRVVPTIGTATSEVTEAELTDDRPSTAMILPGDSPGRDDVEVVVGGDDDIAVFVSTVSGEPIGGNQAAVDIAEEEAELYDDPSLGDLNLLDERGDGRFRIDMPAGEDVVVNVHRLERDVSVELSAGVPFEVLSGTLEGEAVEVGTPLRGIVDGFALEVVHSVDLDADEEVTITVHGGTSDAYFSVVGPGDDYDVTVDPDVDDGGGGLYGLDPSDTYRASGDGEHRIIVGTWDGVVAAYELVVEPAD